MSSRPGGILLDAEKTQAYRRRCKSWLQKKPYMAHYLVQRGEREEGGIAPCILCYVHLLLFPVLPLASGFETSSNPHAMRVALALVIPATSWVIMQRMECSTFHPMSLWYSFLAFTCYISVYLNGCNNDGFYSLILTHYKFTNIIIWSSYESREFCE